ncbi:hypothetical protein EJ08DRAFT_198696 [Tothia fuscella]|uniref:Uncharacterized protein n=1 Tax=Tothia fuscella TaxID=1048955 RepID=A0A9P4TYV7_9PEZI|nr:hypothetical protein EJ08DRAFT_198696 [Tothia fuscella]
MATSCTTRVTRNSFHQRQRRFCVRIICAMKACYILVLVVYDEHTRNRSPRLPLAVHSSLHIKSRRLALVFRTRSKSNMSLPATMLGFMLFSQRVTALPTIALQLLPGADPDCSVCNTEQGGPCLVRNPDDCGTFYSMSIQWSSSTPTMTRHRCDIQL